MSHSFENDVKIIGISIILSFFEVSCVNSFSKPCDSSPKTIEVVQHCPNDTDSYVKAAARKNCSGQQHVNCSSFEYHCVLNDQENETIEVCAPSIFIIDKVCAKFNLHLKSIFRIDGRSCNESDPPCGYRYNSTESYKYPGCFNIKEDRQKLTTTQTPNSSKDLRSSVLPTEEYESQTSPSTDFVPVMQMATSSPNSSLSGGSIAGIVIGAIFTIMILIILSICWKMKQQNLSFAKAAKEVLCCCRRGNTRPDPKSSVQYSHGQDGTNDSSDPLLNRANEPTVPSVDQADHEGLVNGSSQLRDSKENIENTRPDPRSSIAYSQEWETEINNGTNDSSDLLVNTTNELNVSSEDQADHAGLVNSSPQLPDSNEKIENTRPDPRSSIAYSQKWETEIVNGTNDSSDPLVNTTNELNVSSEDQADHAGLVNSSPQLPDSNEKIENTGTDEKSSMMCSYQQITESSNKTDGALDPLFNTNKSNISSGNQADHARLVNGSPQIQDSNENISTVQTKNTNHTDVGENLPNENNDSSLPMNRIDQGNNIDPKISNHPEPNQNCDPKTRFSHTEEEESNFAQNSLPDFLSDSIPSHPKQLQRQNGSISRLAEESYHESLNTINPCQSVDNTDSHTTQEVSPQMKLSTPVSCTSPGDKDSISSYTPSDKKGILHHHFLSSEPSNGAINNSIESFSNGYCSHGYHENVHRTRSEIKAPIMVTEVDQNDTDQPPMKVEGVLEDVEMTGTCMQPPQAKQARGFDSEIDDSKKSFQGGPVVEQGNSGDNNRHFSTGIVQESLAERSGPSDVEIGRSNREQHGATGGTGIKIGKTNALPADSEDDDFSAKKHEKILVGSEEIRTLRKEMADVKSQLKDTVSREEFREKTSELEKQINDLRSELNNEFETNKMLKEKLRTAQENIESLEKEIEKQENIICYLEKRLDKALKELDEYRRRYGELDKG